LPEQIHGKIWSNPDTPQPMEDCKQKFPFMWYFNVLPLSTYCNRQYTTTNWGEQVVALYCTILFMWRHTDELWFDGL